MFIEISNKKCQVRKQSARAVTLGSFKTAEVEWQLETRNFSILASMIAILIYFHGKILNFHSSSFEFL